MKKFCRNLRKHKMEMTDCKKMEMRPYWNQIYATFVKKSKSSNGNDFIVLFKIVLSHFITKLSLKSNLNLLQSVAKMLKSSKFMAQLRCNRWPDIADCLTFLRHFTVRLEIPVCKSGGRFSHNK